MRKCAAGKTYNRMPFDAVLSSMPKLLLLFILHSSFFISANAQGNPSARYEIDAKRTGVSPVDKDAIPRSREFLRLDSTYYVGYMYEGLYLADKSSDVFGFRNAIPPLRRAFNLFEKDYRSKLEGDVHRTGKLYAKY